MTGTNIQLAARTIARCLDIAACTEVPGETTRRFLSPPMREVHALLRGWMEAAGMSVQIDAIGNLRGLRQSSNDSNSPRLIIGSHLDTVPNAGAFDGILGVVLGVSLIEALQGEPLPFAIEVIGFSEEEGVRFNKPFLGSLALIGQLPAEALAMTDSEGISLSEAIRAYGLDPAEFPRAVASKNAFAYLEFHIEQGPILESEGLPLGIVEALVGQTRMEFVFNGHANHAGTTPMHLRYDAMAAAAEWIVSVERYANSHPGLVATVGKVEAIPGAANVIAGIVTATLDLRHVDDAIREAATSELIQAAESAAEKRGVTVQTRETMQQAAVTMDPKLTSQLRQAATHAGVPIRTMTSGAGHDAMIVAQRIPSAVLFLRSPGGLSHHPEETVLLHDVEAALATAMEFLTLLRDDRANTKDGHA